MPAAMKDKAGNSRYLFMSERHAEALAHLLYGVKESGGFIQLTGEVGTGKTTVLRSLLQQLPPHCDVALILNPRVTPAEFLLCICDELHVQVPAAAANRVRASPRLPACRATAAAIRGSTG